MGILSLLQSHIIRQENQPQSMKDSAPLAPAGRGSGGEGERSTRTKYRPTLNRFCQFGSTRLCVLALAVTCIVVLTIAAQSQQPHVSESWPQFRGNTALTGVTQSAVPASLKVVWTYEAGEPIES